MRTTDRNMGSAKIIIERNLRDFGWLQGCMSSELCCAPFTVPKPPPADQNIMEDWRMVVDFRKLNAQTKADSHPLSLIVEEIAPRARGPFFSVLDLVTALFKCH